MSLMEVLFAMSGFPFFRAHTNWIGDLDDSIKGRS